MRQFSDAFPSGALFTSWDAKSSLRQDHFIGLGRGPGALVGLFSTSTCGFNIRNGLSCVAGIDPQRLGAYLLSIKWLLFRIPIYRISVQITYKRGCGVYKGNTSRKSCVWRVGYQGPGQKRCWGRAGDGSTAGSLPRKRSAREALTCSKYFGAGVYIFFLILFLQRRLLISCIAMFPIPTKYIPRPKPEEGSSVRLFQPAHTRHVRGERRNTRRAQGLIPSGSWWLWGPDTVESN